MPTNGIIQQVTENPANILRINHHFLIPGKSIEREPVVFHVSTTATVSTHDSEVLMKSDVVGRIKSRSLTQYILTYSKKISNKQ